MPAAADAVVSRPRPGGERVRRSEPVEQAEQARRISRTGVSFLIDGAGSARREGPRRRAGSAAPPESAADPVIMGGEAVGADDSVARSRDASAIERAPGMRGRPDVVRAGLETAEDPRCVAEPKTRRRANALDRAGRGRSRFGHGPRRTSASPLSSPQPCHRPSAPHGKWPERLPDPNIIYNSPSRTRDFEYPTSMRR
jgi:hypothetical protein